MTTTIPRSSSVPRILSGVAAGAASALGAASVASATQVTYDPPDITIAVNTSLRDIYFDLQTGYAGSSNSTNSSTGLAQFQLDFGTSSAKPALALDSGNPGSHSNLGGAFGQPVTFSSGDSSAVISRFGTNTSINAGSGTLLLPMQATEYSLHSSEPLSSGSYAWNIGDHGFLGLTATSNGTHSPVGSTLYGWAEISYNADSSLTFYRFGYEDSGAASLTPASLAVPEPGSLAVVALGAAGILAWRRRRAGRSLPACPQVWPS